MIIFQFTGDNYYLSNFYPCEFVWNGIKWSHSEGAYQSAKSLDKSVHEQFSYMTASATKKQGKLLHMRSDWEQVKVQIMTEIVYEKFSQNPDIKQKLINTGSAILEEGNSWGDTFWGKCPVGGSGNNMLGKILMTIRKDFQLEEHGIS